MSSFVCRNVSRMTGYTPGEQPKVPGLIKLNTNENPYPPSQRIAEYLAGFDISRLRLYPDPVCSKLRAKIAELHGCSVENVFVGNGSDELLSLCTRAFVENDGSIGFFNPSYSLYPVLAEIRGVETRPVELGPEFDWMMPEGYHADLFFLTNPNAPTSLQYAHDAVRDFCERFGGVVLIDEAYVDFAPYNCIEDGKELTNVIVARTFSKSFSLAGLRVGYGIGSAELISALYKIKDSYNVDMLAQQIALIALEDIGHMRQNVERVKRTRAYMMTELERMGFKVYDSAANFLWVECAGGRAKQYFEALRGGKVLVRYFPGPRTGDFIRVTVGTDEEAGEFLRIAKGIIK